MPLNRIESELLAMITLKEYWPLYQEGFVKSERPDWINRSAGVGVEVTNAMEESDGQLISAFQKFSGVQKVEIPATVSERFLNHFFYDREGRLYGYTLIPGVFDSIQTSADGASLIIESVQKKSSKMNDSVVPYHHMPCNTLFVFTESIPWLLYEDIVYKVWPNIMVESRVYKETFKTIFLLRGEYFYTMNLDPKTDYDQRVTFQQVDSTRLRETLTLYQSSPLENGAIFVSQ